MRLPKNHICFFLAVVWLIAGCRQEKKAPLLFETLDSKRTGLNFSNDLVYNKDFNLFKYIYFYNGSGVGAADFNNDGLIDLYFGSNQHINKLYLNTGALRFKDVTKEAGIPDDGGWSTGISVVDINNDGLMDLYICRVGQYDVLKSKNQFLICQGIDKDGIPHYMDKARDYGLDFSGFSTQAAFFDYDLDGDLDMFLMNHSVHENGTFRPRKDFLNTYHPLAGDRMFRNDGNNHFTDVTRQAGIQSSAIGYGLGIAVADINLDGYPDIYIGNDFHENDYLYINQRNGTFKEENEEHLMHTSQYSMGVDVADANNDAFPEIISLDMLPADPYILKRSLGEDDYDIFNYKIGVGYSYQYARNNFQFNRRNGLFSEIGLYSGISATDWSWAPLWIDFDNDGLKDLFISNGIPKRMNDIDYINFISNVEVQQKIKSNKMEERDMSLIEKFPQIKLPNKFFHNRGDLTFADESEAIGNDRPTFSNGAAYADLDNDGDLDIIVNNIDDPVIVYENKTNERKGRVSLTLGIKGPDQNVNATGAKLVLFTGNTIRTYEKFPVRGFLSSMETPMVIGTRNTKIDSVFFIWPDNSYQKIDIPTGRTSVSVNYQKGLPIFDYSLIRTFYKDSTFPVKDITRQVDLDFLHSENHFVEFDREPLIPQILSTEGPGVAVADINHDHLQDIFIGSSRNAQSAIFIQQHSGKFIRLKSTALEKDSIYEDVAATWTDVNNDGHVDLVVASGGNEFYGKDFHNSPRVYLNDGKGNLTKDEAAFHDLFLTASCVVSNDFNNDGFQDLFIGGRAVPWEYGKIPQSYLLINDKTGKFIDVTNTQAAGLANVGMVTNALWFDIDTDGDEDLILSLQWGSITAFLNDHGKLVKKQLTGDKGWWNFVLPFDMDNDGDIDLIAGNLGLNTRLNTSSEKPVRLYYNDFDNNGKNEQVLTYFLNNKEIPMANKAKLEKQLPILKKKYLYAEDFAKASLKDLLGADKLETGEVLSADCFFNAVFINNGNLSYSVRALPFEAQFSSMKDAVIVNANNDNLLDVLMIGNFYGNNIDMGRYDADFGTLLINRGKGNFSAQTLNGLSIKGQVKHLTPIQIHNQDAYLLVRNSDSAKLIQFIKN